jgi:hypothetical protein
MIDQLRSLSDVSLEAFTADFRNPAVLVRDLRDLERLAIELEGAARRLVGQ